MTANPGTLKFLASARPIATRSPHTNGKVFIPFRSMSRLGFKLFKESQSTCYRPVVASRREYEYIRHGTLGLFGNLHIATGQILSPLIRHTRTEEDFLENIDGLVSTDPTATWRLITDNLNTHASESMVRYVAASCELETDLGVKGRTGVLKSLASRQAFLSDQNHRIHFLYTPKHCSWLNQIEIWFGTLRRKLTRFGSFHSLDDLQDRILRFIDYYNQSMARPYRWTCDGAVLCK